MYNPDCMSLYSPTQDFVLTFLEMRYLCKSLTRSSMRSALTGGIDNRILHLLQVRGALLKLLLEVLFRTCPLGVSRETQLPQK